VMRSAATSHSATRRRDVYEVRALMVVTVAETVGCLLWTWQPGYPRRSS
jgi:hypothetical protein